MANGDPTLLYMIKKPDGWLAVTRPASITKAGAREKFVKSLGRGWTWEKCYRRGCRVVQVSISEVQGGRR